MRPPPTRLLRRALVVLVVVIAGAVVWSLRRPSMPASPGTGPAAPTGEGTSIGEMSFFRFHGGDQKVQVRARAMTGEEGGAMRLEGVEVTFPFTARGEASTATVTADECLYDAEREHARFRGNVHVVTGDGFELVTKSLDYVGDQGRIVGEKDVRFRRGSASGSARGLEYRSAEETLDLASEVRLRFENEGAPPTEVEARSAEGSRRTRILHFDGGVVVREGTREMRSGRLEVTLNPELEAIVRAAAIGAVELRSAGGGGVLGDTTVPAGGERRLRCARLDMDFRSPGLLETAVANRNASLELAPGPGDPPEKRQIEAPIIRFLFDEEGRLTELQAVRPGGRSSWQRRMAVLTAEAIPPARGGRQRVECHRLAARFVAETGALRSAEFQGDVAFTEAGRKAWSEGARYDAGAEKLTLTGDAPRVRDEAEGSELEAQRIELATTSRRLSATGGVRHTVAPRTKERRSGVLGGSEPTVLVSREFEYDPEGKIARYRDSALLRSGKDEIRAPLIVLEEAAGGERRLSASGGASSLLHPRAGTEEAKEPAAVETRSREMRYDEKAGRVVYTGDVEIRQGDILTRSPEAVVTLGPEGETMERLVAGEPVEVRQGTRRATGRTGTYTPDNETLVLVGEPVVLQDEDRRLRGRVLTFKVGDDRIRIDGREEVRTEAIFRKREAPPP